MVKVGPKHRVRWFDMRNLVVDVLRSYHAMGIESGPTSSLWRTQIPG